MNLKDKAPIDENSELNAVLTLELMDELLHANILSMRWNAPKAKDGIFRILICMAERVENLKESDAYKLAKLEGGEMYKMLLTQELIYFIQDRGHAAILHMPKNMSGFFPKEIWVLTQETLDMCEEPQKYKDMLVLAEAAPV